MTKIWGHRGASAYAPENSLPAFELALEQGADGVECDVQLTRDDQVVVIHDETLERTTDGHGWVADHTAAQLRRLDASGGRDGFAGTKVPLLAEVLALIADSGKDINIELKNNRMAYKGLEERVQELVDAAGVASQVVLSSFNHYSLKRLQGLSRLPLGALYTDPLFKPWKYVEKLKVGAIHPPMRWTTRKVVEKSHEHGLKVHAWTVNDAKDVGKLLRRGADAVITDRPDVAREVRDAEG
ncbi:glycerophosphodiester phosphodiesterase [Nigerium massiliense]|uniref:glycerophosphodiester phosphodiesterase n=1 Tax=Nigerium massiliense TaxID=1522317 RepID=UPI00058FF623|nr:glycerophosphodiester phosphodiesterase [Nigerium massiliense]